MASMFHPFYATLWNDDKLEGASFEGKAFFGYLFTNERVRPSGIYRVTDAQLAGDTGLPLARVRGYLADLIGRRLIVRDGAWLFVVGYFKRQPKGPWLLKGVHADLEACSSSPVLEAFRVKYPLHDQQVVRRLTHLSGNGCPTTQRNAVTTQLNGEAGHRASATASASPPTSSFAIPSQILHALERAPRLGAVAPLRAPAWWQAELRANPGVELDRELLKAEAYLVAHPEKHYRKLGTFLHGWFGRADRPEGRPP